jgi:uncharacterized protein YcfL
MRKFAIIILVSLCLSFVACGSNENTSQNKETEVIDATESKETED